MRSLVKDALPLAILFAVCALLIGGVAWAIEGGFSQLTGRSGADDVAADAETMPGPLSPAELAAYDADVTNDMNPIAVLETNQGTIEIELYEDQMPITAGNFKKLVSEGFYDGTQFHRVIDGFMIQGGDPITKTNEVLRYGTGDPGYTIPDEHVSGEKLTNVRGTIAMANSGPESGGSQFFINLENNQRLDFDKPPLSSQHPVFGKVVGGMDVVDAIAAVETNPRDLPVEPVVIERATLKQDE